MWPLYLPRTRWSLSLNELSDDALKKESTSEAKSDTFSSIMKVQVYLYTYTLSLFLHHFSSSSVNMLTL